MMYTIAKRFTFDAAHQLVGLPTSHKCSRLHGHTYSVEVVLQSEYLVGPGFVVDYTDLAAFKEFISAQVDHRNLNEVVGFPTTSENLACWFYQWCKQRWPVVVAVRVSETSATWAEYRE